LRKTLSDVNKQGWGIALGLMFGVILFVATNALVLKGGSDVGAHLGLLSVYFPGYDVTFLGSMVGFVYAFVLGYGVGRSVVAIYNYVTVRWRS
jgi:hypothetical protein